MASSALGLNLHDDVSPSPDFEPLSISPTTSFQSILPDLPSHSPALEPPVIKSSSPSPRPQPRSSRSSHRPSPVPPASHRPSPVLPVSHRPSPVHPPSHRSSPGPPAPASPVRPSQPIQSSESSPSISAVTAESEPSQPLPVYNEWKILYDWEFEGLRKWEMRLEDLRAKMQPLQEKIWRLELDEGELYGQCGIEPPSRSKKKKNNGSDKKSRKKRDIVWGEFGEWFSFVSDQIESFQIELDALEREKQKAYAGIRKTTTRMEKIRQFEDDSWISRTLASALPNIPPPKKSTSRQSISALIEMTEMELADLPSYQDRWAYLQSSASSKAILTFQTIPWPVSSPPNMPSSISSDSIHSFLTLVSSSETDGNEKSLKSTLRNAVFLWHPDNFIPKYLVKVEETERPLVLEGVQKVIECLDEIMHSLDASPKAESEELKASR
ncbi:hypothetical protein FRC02_001874 [Tulasnella sp. 418]|nr:hypothetical protein FRC02_001874 [Tulasnella sp. 418]